MPYLAYAEIQNSSVKPYPRGVQADLWVLAGQSNVLGWALLKAPIEPDPGIMQFNREQQWVMAEEPLHQLFFSKEGPVRQNILLQRNNITLPDGMTVEAFVRRLETEKRVMGGVGPGLAFAKHLRKYINRPIGLIPWQHGGSSMKQWDPADGQSLYSSLMDRIKTVGGPIKGVIWYQGETDGQIPQATEVYETALLNLFDCLRRDLKNPDLPIICVQLGPFFCRAPTSVAASYEKVREIQRCVAHLRENTYIVSSIDLSLDDAIHLSFESQQRLGRRLAEIALTKVYHMPAHGRPIDLAAIEVLQPQSERPMIRVRFSGVSGRLRAEGRPYGFELRSSEPGSDPLRMVYRVDFDPNDPAALILGVFHPFVHDHDKLVYGGGLHPYANIVDEKDIPIPAFGPIDLPPVKGK